jgi:hypothetical protein
VKAQEHLTAEDTFPIRGYIPHEPEHYSSSQPPHATANRGTIRICQSDIQMTQAFMYPALETPSKTAFPLPLAKMNDVTMNLK